MICKENIEHIHRILNEYSNYIFEFDDDNIRIEQIKDYIHHLETKLKEEYTRGYIKRDTEAQKICRECKYIKRVKELEELKEREGK